MNTEEQKLPLAVDEIQDILKTSRKGNASNSIQNCLTVLRYDSTFQDAIKHNCLTGRTDIVKDLGWKRDSTTLTDTDMKYIQLYFEQNYQLTSEKKISSAVSIISNENQYHPIRDYLNSLTWDGIGRVRYALHRYLGADASDFTYDCLRLFMLGAVNRVFQPGCKFETMLCLVGGQGAGKSTFFRLLAVKDEWFSDDLRRLDDDNVYRKLEGHWIIEMSEMLATANAKSIEEIKSFISRQKETYKVPYETYPADRLRQCVFGGTTNKQDFLPKDRTGNRRFLPIKVHPEQAEKHILDDVDEARRYIDQMWAEIMELYRAGNYSLTLSADSVRHLKEYQADFTQEDAQAGLIYAFLEDFKGHKVCSKLLYKEALNHPNNEPADWETRSICEIVNTGIENGNIIGWRAFKNPKRFPDYGKQKGWERIPAQTDEPHQMEFEEITDDGNDMPW